MFAVIRYRLSLIEIDGHLWALWCMLELGRLPTPKPKPKTEVFLTTETEVGIATTEKTENRKESPKFRF